MLTYFKKNKLVDYPIKQPKNWEEAIHLSCQTLLKEQYITEEYITEIVQAIKQFGPYIVIMPNIAMPHAEGNPKSVIKSGISFTKFHTPVFFYDEKTQEEKSAQLFFTLAAQNADEHLQNITRLTDLLSNDTLIEALLKTENEGTFDNLLTHEKQLN
ncbi:PTS sugar transporter subunit IIA [Enterococcus sp. LJL98]